MAATPAGLDRKHTLVIVASALGTVFEWYDFYIYGTLAAFFGKLFFPAGNETAAYLSSLALFGVGFSVRPFGALVFGRLGDIAGRKYTFLITIVIMGLSTALVGMSHREHVRDNLGVAGIAPATRAQYLRFYE